MDILQLYFPQNHLDWHLERHPDPDALMDEQLLWTSIHAIQHPTDMQNPTLLVLNKHKQQKANIQVHVKKSTYESQS
jgi:hypothetical protein